MDAQDSLENCAESLEAAYQIGQFIHSVGSQSSDPTRPNMFSLGPNSRFEQTQRGLILEEKLGGGASLHTPCGEWTLPHLGNPAEAVSASSEVLGLRPLERRDEESALHERSWAVTRWKGSSLPSPVHRLEEEYIDCADVRTIWTRFASQHKGLASDI